MREVSVRGKVIRDMIAHVANDNLIGRKLKTGELRKKLVEPKWHCPDCFYLEDMNSTNGTYRNGELLNYRERVQLEKNDRVIFAKEKYRFV